MRSLLQDDTKSAHKKLACLAECVLKPMCTPTYLATPSRMAKFGQLAMTGEWISLVCFVNVHNRQFTLRRKTDVENGQGTTSSRPRIGLVQ